MKRFLFTFQIILLSAFVWAQEAPKPKKPSKPRHLKTWRISELLAVPDTIPVDTAFVNFHEHTPVDIFSIANAYNSNLGSPLQSKIYVKRPQGSDFLFDDPYRPYTMDICSATFYDVKFPYTNLTYRTGGPAYRKEDQVKFTLALSPSKKANFGVDVDYVNAIGDYDNQAVRRFAGSAFGRYSGKHYSAYGLLVTNSHKNYESGGLQNLSVLEDPQDAKPQDFLTNITGYSAFAKNQLFYSHAYSIGFNRQIKVSEDSVRFEYVPITHFGHTLRLEEMRKRYYEPTVMGASFYENTYFNKTGVTNDTAAVRTMSNTFYINLDERFNKWMKFGLTGYVENEIQQFTYQQEDAQLTHTLKSNTRVGGVLSKTQGTNFTYSLLGDIYLIGYKLGEFRLEGKANGNFKLFNRTISLSANAAIRNEEPSFFLQHYYSNHFKWENNFSKIYRTSVGGLFALPATKTQLKVDVENITNPVFFNEKALPEQHKSSVQIISADLSQDFRLGAFHLDNRVTYQMTSNSDVMPLPTFAFSHKLYYLGTWFHVLTAQIGVDAKMHTKYYVPNYMPATGQFYVQKSTQLGNYPLMNAYVNFHLKQARFFVEYYHINRLFMKGDYFFMPNYPFNQPGFKMGISWNFFN